MARFARTPGAAVACSFRGPFRPPPERQLAPFSFSRPPGPRVLAGASAPRPRPGGSPGSPRIRADPAAAGRDTSGAPRHAACSKCRGGRARREPCAGRGGSADRRTCSADLLLAPARKAGTPSRKGGPLKAGLAPGLAVQSPGSRPWGSRRLCSVVGCLLACSRRAGSALRPARAPWPRGARAPPSPPASASVGWFAFPCLVRAPACVGAPKAFRPRARHDHDTCPFARRVVRSVCPWPAARAMDVGRSNAAAAFDQPTRHDTRATRPDAGPALRAREADAPRSHGRASARAVVSWLKTKERQGQPDQNRGSCPPPRPRPRLCFRRRGGSRAPPSLGSASGGGPRPRRVLGPSATRLASGLRRPRPSPPPPPLRRGRWCLGLRGGDGRPRAAPGGDGHLAGGESWRRVRRGGRV